MPQTIITLTTDFGQADSYVAQMKGVMLGINPVLQLVDISHAVPPQNRARAASVLNEAVDAFPPGSIHVVVVDPGVGTDRRLLGVEAGGQRFVAPDNGVLSTVARRLGIERAVELTEQKYWRQPVSETFHGRDVMAPVAAHWSLEIDLAQFGQVLEGDLIGLPTREPTRHDGGIVGEIVWSDAFGNLITNIDRSLIPEDTRAKLTVQAGSCRIHGISRCYGEQTQGALLALLGSHGRLEIAVNGGSASDHLGLKIGDEVRVRIGTEIS